jgi:hypothetical protein
MESLLIAVTVISLALAVTMSVVAWTLLKAERQRAAARIEALEALAFSGEPERQEPVAEAARVPVAAIPVAPATPSVPASAPSLPKVIEAPVDDSTGVPDDELVPEFPDWDAVIRGHASQAGHGADVALPNGRIRAVLPDAMFGTEPASNAGTRRLLAVAAVGLIIAAGYAAAAAMRSPEVVAALVASTPPPSAEPQPLELLSLRHSPDTNGGFAVSGFVQNPAGGKDLTNVEVVVYLFDDKDQYFMTGRAALETADMRTGTDSTFDVHVPGATHVGRFRVGFRQADGTVVAHVDRRGQFPEGTSETVSGPDQVRPAGVAR